MIGGSTYRVTDATIVSITGDDGTVYDLSGDEYDLVIWVYGGWHKCNMYWNGSFNVINTVVGNVGAVVPVRFGVTAHDANSVGEAQAIENPLLYEDTEVFYVYNQNVHTYAGTNGSWLLLEHTNADGEKEICAYDTTGEGIAPVVTGAASVEDVDWNTVSDWGKCDHEVNVESLYETREYTVTDGQTALSVSYYYNTEITFEGKDVSGYICQHQQDGEWEALDSGTEYTANGEVVTIIGLWVVEAEPLRIVDADGNTVLDITVVE